MKALRKIIVIHNLVFIALFYLVSIPGAFFFLSSTLFFCAGYFIFHHVPLTSRYSLIYLASLVLPSLTLILLQSFLFPFSSIDFNVQTRKLWIAIAIGICAFALSNLLYILIRNKACRNSLFIGMVILFSTTPINAYNHAIYLSITGLVYISTMFVFRLQSKERGFIRALIVFAPFFMLIVIPTIIFRLERAYPSLVVVPISLVTGWFIAKLWLQKQLFLFRLSAVFVLSMLVVIYFAMLNWLAYLSIEKDFRLDSQVVRNLMIHSGIAGADTMLPDAPDESANPHITVLYFFTRYCWVCFEKMPELESFHQEYSDDSRVRIMAVNLQTRDSDTTFNFAAFHTDKGYSFPYHTVSPNFGLIMMEKLNIKAIPHVLLVDARFEPISAVGGFQTSDYYILGNTRRLVEKHLR